MTKRYYAVQKIYKKITVTIEAYPENYLTVGDLSKNEEGVVGTIVLFTNKRKAAKFSRVKEEELLIFEQVE